MSRGPGSASGAADAAEDDGDALVVADRGARRQHAGQAGGAGRRGVDVGVVGDEVVGPAARRLVDLDGASRRSPPSPRPRGSSRRSRRRGSRPPPTNRPAPTATSATTSVRPAPARHGVGRAPRPAPAARSPSVCTACRRTPGAGRPRRRRPARRRRPGRTGGRGRRAEVGHLPTDRPPAVEAPDVLRALHAERHRPVGDGLAEAVHARVARRIVGPPRAGDDPGPRVRRAVRAPTRRRSAGRTRRSASRPNAASVAAAIAALPHEAMASGGRSRHGARPSSSAARRCRRMVNRWRALWLPPTWPGLVLEPHPAVGGEAERVAQPVVAGERRDREAAAARPARRRARRAPPPSSRWPRRTCPTPAGSGSDRTDRRRRRRVGAAGAVAVPTNCSAWRRSQRGGVRATPGQRRGDVDVRAAHGAHEPGGHDGAATRALKSMIISSHTGRKRRRSAPEAPAPGGPRTARTACPAARPTCSSRG